MRNLIVIVFTTVLALTLVGSAAMAADLNTDGNINLTAASPWIIMDDRLETGSLAIQAGFGSGSAGGSIILYGAEHSTRAGWVVVGLPHDADGAHPSVGKFAVYNSAAGSGTQLFVVDYNGNVSIGPLTPTAGYKLDVDGVILADDVDIVGTTVSVLDLINKVAVLEATPPEAQLLARLEALEAIVQDLPPGLRNIDRNGDGK